MTARSTLLATLLAVGILLVGLVAVLTAEAALVPDRSYETPPPLRLDSLDFLAQEAALKLFRQGCLEAKIVAFPDPHGRTNLFAICVEWREVRPASQ
ncbi:MAG: hypothetical protein ACE5NC_12000 [Anaerolineae bacterium]